MPWSSNSCDQEQARHKPALCHARLLVTLYLALIGIVGNIFIKNVVVSNNVTITNNVRRSYPTLLPTEGNSTATTHSTSPVTILLFSTGGKRAKRAQSIFHTGLLRRFGTGRVDYTLEEKSESDCEYKAFRKSQQDGPCLAVDHFPGCFYDDLIRQYPTCKTMLINDEFCEDGGYDARGYYSSTLTNVTYLPLGPRYDSWDAFETLNQNGSTTITASSQRKYVFNAIFSENTSAGRSILADINKKQGNDLASFVQIAEYWQPDPNNPSNDLLDTTSYIQVLLESTFTLAPAGYNPESFRLYEAVEAGSIPVVALDKDYRKHACKDSLSHWLDSPIVFVNSWNEVFPTLQKLIEDREALDKRQSDLRTWYNRYMSSVVEDFESFLLAEKGKGK